MARTLGFWVILAGNTPTAFRAKDRDTLLPTFKQLQRTQPTVSLQWFERNRLWSSPEEARAVLIARRNQEHGRTRDWRPGGSHEDPRAKYQLSRDEKRARFKRQARGPFPPADRPAGAPPSERPTGPPPSERPRSDRPWGKPPSDRPRSDRPWGKPPSDRARPPRPEWRRDGERPPGRPRGDRPGPPRPDRPWGPPRDRSGPPRSDRPGPARRFRPRPDRPFRPSKPKGGK